MTTKSKAQDKHKMSEIDENISKLFDIKKRLGKGAYGIVWKALDKRNNETIAVKKIFDAFRDETDAQRTFREIIFLKSFRNHPNIVKLHNVYKASNNLDIYLIFEYMESDLHNIIKKGSILKDIHKRYVMYQLINAIKYIHSGNVIHRDLKPSNVLIDSKCRCKLADFGLARSVSNRPVREDPNHTNSDLPVDPLLTDYVATRWYRAPEILVASKRYTKGIDMWSLGCILGEMIRGKPLFQGTSTIDQIEKIVSTLPDITESDIKAVDAGFGSVLLSKAITKEKKTTLNDLLIDASKDALDMVKSLLLLDPMSRLTAQQALGHPYVEKFRNSIPEIELNVDVLPPFRDDIRLTVPEYRSKLYEIVHVSGGEKRQTDLLSKPLTATTKLREHKSQEKSDPKRSIKMKHNANNIKSEDIRRTAKNYEGDTQQYSAISACNANNKTPLKVSPLSKRKQSKMPKDFKVEVEDDTKCIDQMPLADGQMQRRKSHGRHHQNLAEDVEKCCLPNVKRHSVADGESVQQNFNSSLKSLTSTRRLCRSSTALNSVDSDVNGKSLQQNFTSIDNIAPTAPVVQTKSALSSLRPTKSEMYPTKKSSSNEAKERICYERRLKILEEEIERYKNDVKTFCRETFSYSKQKKQLPSGEKIHNNNQYNHNKPITQRSATTNTPIKTTYFQLLSKGNHHEANKSDFDLSSGNSTGSDHFIPADNLHSFSGRSKETNKHLHKYNSLQRSHQHLQCFEKQSQQSSHGMLQKPQRSRPLSKFI